MMKRLALLLLLPVTLFAQGYYSPNWVAHVDGDARIGGWREGGHLTLFAPLGQLGCNLVFAQGSIGRFKDSWTGTLGGGWRVQLQKDLGWGVNLFCDYAYSDRTNLHWVQGGIGGEVIGSCFEFRANAYVPRLDRQVASERRPFIVDLEVLPAPGHVRPVANITQFTIRHQEQARWGFDVEGGAGFCAGFGSLWGYLGYYRFQGSGLPTFEGPRVRGEYKLPLPLSWGEAEIWVGGEYTRDRVHGSQGVATVHVQVPLFCQRRFGRCSNLCVFKKLGDSVRRNNGIVLKRFVTRSVSQRQVGLWFIRINAPDNDPGTQTMPTSLNTVNTFSQPGDFVFVLNQLPGFQPIPIGTELGGQPYTLKNEQTLVSFGNNNFAILNFGGGVTFRVNDLDGAGRGGLIQNQAGVSAVIIGNNNVIQGTSIQNGVNSIVGANRTNLLVTDTNVNGYTSAGIGLANMLGTVTLTGNDVDGGGAAGTSGIEMINSGAISSSGVFTGNTVRRQAVNGILAGVAGSGATLQAVIDGNTVEDIGAGGVGGIVLVTDPGSTGGNLAFRVSNNRVTTSATQAIVGRFGGAAGAANNVNGAVTSNAISTVTGMGAVQMQPAFTNNADVATLLINSNSFNAVTDEAIIANNITAGTMNVTITDNRDANPQAGSTTVINVSNVSTACLTATGNSTNRPGAPDPNFRGTNLLGTMQVTNQAQLSANNNNMTVTLFGTTNTTESCPLPTVP